jgi:hypothetical protein
MGVAGNPQDPGRRSGRKRNLNLSQVIGDALAGGLQVGFFARPAVEKRRQFLLRRHGMQLGILVSGEELRRDPVKIRPWADLFDVHADRRRTRHGE